MGYLSILVGFFLVLFLICKKWPAIIVGIIATAAVIVMNWLNFGQTFTDVYFTGFATMVKSLFPPIFAGNLVAQIYNRTAPCALSAIRCPMHCSKKGAPRHAPMSPAFSRLSSPPACSPTAA